METREATPADYPAFVRLFQQLGTPDPVADAARFASEIMPGMLVAGEPEVAGYALWRSYGATAHVVHLAVDAAARRRGIGRALLERVRRAAAGAGCVRWYLNVKRDNAPAIRLYESCGFRLELESWALRVPWAVAAKLPSGGGVAATIGPADDAAIAARFGLEPGRVASLRDRQGYVAVAVAVREGGELAGFAAFDPGFPGASPFCVARPELTGALLAACRAHARPEHDHIRLAIEGDRAAAELLIAAGAELTFEILRLAAPL
jgi:GNAT superfamily N-acetyltransferase